MIAFDTFRNKAAELAKLENSENLAIRVDLGAPGMLGTYEVRNVQLSDEDIRHFDAVRKELTAALTKEYGVDSVDKLPESVRKVLVRTEGKSSVQSADILEIAKQLNEFKELRQTAVNKLCEIIASTEDLLSGELERCGFSNVTIPVFSKFSLSLNYVVDKAFKAIDLMTSKDQLETDTKALFEKAKNDIEKIIHDAFGDDNNKGPLVDAMTKANGSSDRISEAINGYEPPTMPEEVGLEAERLAPSTVGTEQLSEDLTSKNPANVRKEVVKQLATVNTLVTKLLGEENCGGLDDSNSGLPDNCPLVWQLKQLQDKRLNLTVGDVRKRAQEIITKHLGTKEKPTVLAQALKAIGNKNELVGRKRLQVAQALMLDYDNVSDSQRRDAYIYVCRQAIDDSVKKISRNMIEASQGKFEGCDIIDDDDLPPMDTDVRLSLDYILRSSNATADTLEQLVDLVLKGGQENHDSIVKLSRDMGCKTYSASQMHKKFKGYTYEDLQPYLMRTSIKIAFDPDFNVYLQQRIGAMPRDVKNGKEIYCYGDFLENPKYAKPLCEICHILQDNPPTGGVVYSNGHDIMKPHGFSQPVGARYDKDLAAFEKALNSNNKGGFKTAPARTKGQLYIDSKNSLKSANRHFGSSVPSTAEENFRLKQVFIDALRKAGGSDDFLEQAKNDIGLNGPDKTKPLSRQVAKSLILRLRSTNGGVTGSSATAVSGKNVVSVPSTGGNDNPKSLANRNIVGDPRKTDSKMTGTQIKAPAKTVATAANQTVGVDSKPVKNYTSPQQVDIHHANGYSDLWRGSADLLRRQILFSRGSKEFRMSLPLGRLDPNGSAYSWLKSLSSSHGKALSECLVNTLARLPGMSDMALNPNTLLTYLNSAFSGASNMALVNHDQALDKVARQMAASVFAIRKNAKPDPHQIGMMKSALVDAMIVISCRKDITEMMQTAIVEQGGGLIHDDAWSFEEGGKVYRSEFKPRADIEKEMGVTNQRSCHLTGLSKSKLSDETGKANFMTFLRFGEVACSHYSGKKDIQSMYQELAEQMFLNNEKLVKDAKDGMRIELPMVRTDLAGHERLDGELKSFDLKFRPGKDKPEITVHIQPKIEHFCLPIDTMKESAVLLDEKEMSLNEAAWKSMSARVNKYDGGHKKEVQALAAQIDDYFTNVLNKKPISAYENFGAELTRLGARIGVLASLLGDVPAVNCNWGRDRTGAMDNEFKLTMLHVLAGEDLPPICLNEGETDPWIAQRTRMLESTGNRQIAKQVNCSVHDLNLHQFGKNTFSSNGKTLGTSGLPSLYHESALPKLSMRSEANRRITAFDNGGMRKSPENICKELLGKDGKVRENLGGGHCFFYSAFQQMTEEEKTQLEINGGQLDANAIIKFRKKLVRHLEESRNSMPPERKAGLFKQEDTYYVTTSKGQVPVDEAFFPLEDDVQKEGFTNGSDNADIAQAPFLADMLKRPVIVISADTFSSGASMIKFDRDLATGQPFQNQEPIIMYYNRFDENGGHFRAVETQP